MNSFKNIIRVFKNIENQSNILPFIRGAVTNNRYIIPTKLNSVSLHGNAEDILKEKTETELKGINDAVNELELLSQKLNHNNENMPNIEYYDNIEDKLPNNKQEWKNTLLFEHPMCNNKDGFNPFISIGVNISNANDTTRYESVIINQPSYLKVSDIIPLKYDKDTAKIMKDTIFIKTRKGMQYVPDLFKDLPLYFGGNDQTFTTVLVKVKKTKSNRNPSISRLESKGWVSTMYDKSTNSMDGEFILNNRYILNPHLYDVEHLVAQGYIDIQDVKFIHGTTNWTEEDTHKILDTNTCLVSKNNNDRIMDVIWDNTEYVWNKLFNKCSDIDVVKFIKWYKNCVDKYPEIRSFN